MVQDHPKPHYHHCNQVTRQLREVAGAVEEESEEAEAEVEEQGEEDLNELQLREVSEVAVEEMWRSIRTSLLIFPDPHNSD